MPSNTMTKKTYSKMDPVSHILHRPDTYVGSTRSKSLETYVADESFKIQRQTVKYPPALLRIFVEPLSNAIDNAARSESGPTPCKKIKVTVDAKTGKTTIWNNGDFIPIEMNDAEGMYNHSLIFGQLLTSSNYDDSKDRYNISGRNGLGVKLCNVFSSHFTVKGIDPERGLAFSQDWKNNMKTELKAKVKKSKLKTGSTEVSFTPDFSQFGLKGYTTNIINLFRRYVVDTAMLTTAKVYFNDELVPVKTLKDYAQLFGETENVLHVKDTHSQMVVVPATSFEAISFVNGVHTSLGGTHVDAWVEACLRPVANKLTKPKGPTFSLADVKKFFRFFVNARVINPEFESQSKHRLESPFNVTIKKKDVNALLRWSVIDAIKRSKEALQLKKLERKRKAFVRIDGLDPANNEGGAKSPECTLILVEGLSAKTYAVQGIEMGAFGKKGRDWFGIYALRGKVLNVRNAKTAAIAKNAVITDIIKALGIKPGVDYTDEANYRSLRYGRVMIITDADADGIHISGLIQNVFHSLFPSVLDRPQAFITSMQTPIVRVFLRGGKHRLFYDEREYHKYAKTHANVSKKYYKGLGSSSSKDIKETFGVKLVNYRKDDNIDHTMNKIFHSKHADARKTWMKEYDPERVALKWSGDKPEVVNLSVTDFLDTELIKFSLDDCKRSIPSMMDGLKESQRKALYASFLRNLSFQGKTLKVAQLAGFIAEKTSYHHGEQNLYDTITRMANNFVGSNNIPFFYRDGQFGSRLSGGKDAANARYIFTKLDRLTRLLFPKQDDGLLERVVDDGDVVEPVFYAPILPTILINGCSAGIGTGWSSSVPCYNPLDLCRSVRCWMNGEALPELTPWYNGFTGTIQEDKKGKYVSSGVLREEKRGNKVTVTELPVGLWVDNFKAQLDTLREKKEIRQVRNYSSPTEVKFVITPTAGKSCTLSSLKLHRPISTTNMVLFDENGSIHHYKTAQDIVSAFCAVRLEYYAKRKAAQLKALNASLKIMGNKRRFLEAVMNDEIELFVPHGRGRKSKSVKVLEKELADQKYDRVEKSYDYLLRMQFRDITEEHIDKLKNDIATTTQTRNTLKALTERQLWDKDLTAFENEYTRIECQG